MAALLSVRRSGYSRGIHVAELKWEKKTAEEVQAWRYTELADRFGIDDFRLRNGDPRLSIGATPSIANLQSEMEN